MAQTTPMQYLFLPDANGNVAVNRLAFIFATQLPRSTSSSANEQFSES